MVKDPTDGIKYGNRVDAAHQRHYGRLNVLLWWALRVTRLRSWLSRRLSRNYYCGGNVDFCLIAITSSRVSTASKSIVLATNWEQCCTLWAHLHGIPLSEARSMASAYTYRSFIESDRTPARVSFYFSWNFSIGENLTLAFTDF